MHHGCFDEEGSEDVDHYPIGEPTAGARVQEVWNQLCNNLK